MNRLIKFREWSKEYETMFGPWTIEQIAGGQHVTRFDKDGVLMQFTSLLDKNGKEIYEGDIVKQVSSYTYPSGRHVSRTFYRMIVWIHGAFHVSNSKRRANKTPHLHPVPAWKQKMEVIGNIYENKELISQLKG